MHKVDAETRRGIGKKKPDMMLYYYVDGPSWLGQNQPPEKDSRKLWMWTWQLTNGWCEKYQPVCVCGRDTPKYLNFWCACHNVPRWGTTPKCVMLPLFLRVQHVRHFVLLHLGNTHACLCTSVFMRTFHKNFFPPCLPQPSQLTPWPWPKLTFQKSTQFASGMSVFILNIYKSTRTHTHTHSEQRN